MGIALDRGAAVPHPNVMMRRAPRLATLPWHPGPEVHVMNDVRGRAQRLLGTPVRLADLALAFDESRAATAEVHVEGRSFFPPMLADIGTAASSVHINQFGFRPGTIGEAFATALLGKAAEGVHVRLVVDGQGSRPDGSSRELYGRLLAGGVDVRVVRATRLRALSQPAAPAARGAGA
jgi:phosphatidylserine/phosphatidylglycerophosphate/cardiolipin synthase-like enzyme